MGYQKDIIKYFAIVVLSAALFALDIITELGVASGVNYVCLVLLALWLTKPSSSILLVIIATVLILVGWYFSPDGGEVWKVTLNRVYSLVAVWAVAIALYFHLLSKQKLKEEKERFEATSLELKQQVETLNTSAIVSITDNKGNIISVNDMFCKISKYEREELVGKNHRVLKSGKQSDGIFKGMWKAISMGKTWKGVICNKAKDGSFYWVATTIAPFFNKAGEIEKYVSVRFDITTQIEQEKALENRAKELENANQQLEAFSYTVSHDLKAPLRALQGFSDNLYKKYNDKFDETGLRWLQYVKDNAVRMDQLIQDVLTFSRLGKTKAKLSLVDTASLVDKIIQAEQKHYKNKLKLSIGKLHGANADSTMFEMLWQNLIGNAFKYSSTKEEIEITINSKKLEDKIEYAITDNGVGFDMKYYDKLFKAFHRLHGNEEFEGTGIGLANVKRIIDKHNGAIKAVSEIGKGTTFIFTIPE